MVSLCEREAACTWVSTAIGALKALKCRGSANDETGSVNVTGKVYDVIKGGTQISANSDNRLICWAYSALQRLVSTWIYNSVASSHKTGYKLHRVPLTDWLPSVSAHHWWVLPETRPTCGLSPTESFSLALLEEGIKTCDPVFISQKIRWAWSLLSILKSGTQVSQREIRDLPGTYSCRSILVSEIESNRYHADCVKATLR